MSAEALRDRVAAPDLARLIEKCPALGPFVVSPYEASCTQGAFSYAALALAQRADRVLFVATDTRQFGVATRTTESAQMAMACQYPTPEAACLVFISEELPGQGP